MALSERLYELRKKSGLSQEQLAERLGVSRQAVSKWESGKSVPESDTLISLSAYYHVTLDYLVNDHDVTSEEASGAEENLTKNQHGRIKRGLGIAICLLGLGGLLVWGVVSVLMPAALDRIGTSSAITIDGNGIFFVICLVAVAAGAVLLLRSLSDK